MEVNVVPPNMDLARKLSRYAWIVSILVFIVVASMRRIKIDTDVDFSWLPAVYSTLNGISRSNEEAQDFIKSLIH